MTATRSPAPDLTPPLAQPSVFVRPSREADVPAMLAIYLHHIRNGVDPNYAVPFRKRPAYRYTVKHSIYVRNDRLGRGIGRMLLAALVDACAAGGYRQMIGYIDGANEASFRLHKSFGFHEVGRLPSVGYKFGHWTDSVMMQRSLGLGASAPPER